MATSIYGNMTPYPRHFHVVFDVASCLLNPSIIALKPGPPSAKLIPKCLVLNTRSLVKPVATSASCTEVTTNKIDVCFISETWLNRNVHSSFMCPDRYALIRKDRLHVRPGGDVAILCRKDWKINKLDYNDTVFECLWCGI